MKFEFRGFDKEGNFKSGIIEAADQNSALKILHEQGLVVTYIKSFEKTPVRLPWGKINLLDLSFFCFTLAKLIEGGISLDTAIKTIALQTKKIYFRNILEDIYNSINSGLPFSQALEKHPQAFDKSMVKMIRIGEISGNLPEVLENLAKHFETQSKFRRRLILSLFYPILVLLIFLATMIVLFFYVIPQIARLFEENNLTLPLITRYLVLISNFLVNYSIYLVLFLIFFFYLVFEYLKTDEGKLSIYNFFPNIPVIGSLMKKIEILNFLESLVYLIKGGIPIAEALNIIAESTTNPYYKNAISFIAQETEKGKDVSTTMKGFPDLFPEMVIQSFTSGEKTGHLSEGLSNLISFYLIDVENQTNTLTEALQPIMVIILAIGILFLELSLILPISELSKALRTF